MKFISYISKTKYPKFASNHELINLPPDASDLILKALQNKLGDSIEFINARITLASANGIVVEHGMLDCIDPAILKKCNIFAIFNDSDEPFNL